MITSGDWKYDPAWAVVETSDGISICDLGPRNDANGYLLAAAPDLLVALKELMIAADPHTNMSDIVIYDALSVARNAIAKARGQKEEINHE